MARASEPSLTLQHHKTHVIEDGRNHIELCFVSVWPRRRFQIAIHVICQQKLWMRHAMFRHMTSGFPRLYKYCRVPVAGSPLRNCRYPAYACLAIATSCDLSLCDDVYIRRSHFDVKLHCSCGSWHVYLIEFIKVVDLVCKSWRSAHIHRCCDGTKSRRPRSENWNVSDSMSGATSLGPQGTST